LASTVSNIAIFYRKTLMVRYQQQLKAYKVWTHKQPKH